LFFFDLLSADLFAGSKMVESRFDEEAKESEWKRTLMAL
jgi:hypothetical protein